MLWQLGDTDSVWERLKAREQRERVGELRGNKKKKKKTPRTETHVDKWGRTFTAFLTPFPLISSLASPASLAAFGISWYAAVALITTWTPGEGAGSRRGEKKKKKDVKRGTGNPREKEGGGKNLKLENAHAAGLLGESIAVQALLKSQEWSAAFVYFLRVALIMPACAHCNHDKMFRWGPLCLDENSANVEKRASPIIGAGTALSAFSPAPCWHT